MHRFTGCKTAIGALTAHFVEHYNRLFGKNVRFVSPQAVAVLTGYEWPGNVRELSNIIENAAIQAATGKIEPKPC